MAIVNAAGGDFSGIVTCSQTGGTTLGKLGGLVIETSNDHAYVEIVRTSPSLVRHSFLRFSNANTSGNILVANTTFSGNVTAFDTSIPSDIRIKDNIQDIDNPLQKVLSIRGVTYHHKNDENKKIQIGVIAQEIEKVLPNVITESYNPSDITGNDMIKTVSYNQLIPLLIEAVKEQNKIINELKLRLDILEKSR